MKKYLSIIILAVLISLSSCIEEVEMLVPCYATLKNGEMIPLFEHKIVEDQLIYKDQKWKIQTIQMSEVKTVQCGPYKPLPIS